MQSLALMFLVATPLGQVAPPQIHRAVEPAKADMVLKWNEIALATIRADKSPPPIAARNLAIMHTSIYDAVMAIARTHEPYLVDLQAPAGVSMEAASAAAAHWVLAAQYPRQRDYFDDALARCWKELPNDAAVEEGARLGRLVADRMLQARRHDGSSEAGSYSFKRNPGSWQPTAPHFKDALLPGWGHVKPFAIKPGTQHRPPGPPALASEAFRAAYEEVRRLGGKDSTARTPEQTQIALFWADDAGTVTPPGHWNKIAQAIALDRGNSLPENARLFAHLNMSLADAGILCWVIKFTFDFWRPVSAIAYTDRRDDWMPLLNTPPFPAYVSGHSTFSSAAASVLAQTFGTDKITFATTSDDMPGVTRKFDSLWAAAEEAGMSRIYGGIHWQFDNTDGLHVGRTLGEYVVRNTLKRRER
jgi:membrane-associated phospholipid phosphatase